MRTTYGGRASEPVVTEPLPPIVLQPTVEQKILAALERIEKLLTPVPVRHTQGKK